MLFYSILLHLLLINIFRRWLRLPIEFTQFPIILIVRLQTLMGLLRNLLFKRRLILGPQQNQCEKHNQIYLAGAPIFQHIPQIMILLIDILNSMEGKTRQSKREIYPTSASSSRPVTKQTNH